MSNQPTYKGIEAVFFDMDGTLVDTEPAATEATILALKDFGKEMSLEDADQVIGIPWQGILRMCIRNYQLDTTEEALMEKIIGHKKAILADALRVMPGAVEAFRFCASKIPVAVVSGSYREEIRETLTAIGLANTVRFWVGAEDTDPGKPSPLPYLEAAKRMGVNPKNCIVFEDSEMGVTAAKKAGTHTVVVLAAGYERMDLSMADQQIPTLETVKDDWLDETARLMEAS